MKEYLVRLIYCEMLGHSTPFGYIHAVKFAQQASLFEKRVGYLAVSLMLHENHELILLLINTIQKDLKSANIVEVCMALTVLTRLINAGKSHCSYHVYANKPSSDFVHFSPTLPHPLSPTSPSYPHVLL